MASTEPRRIIVGITGASGAVYAQRLIQCLLDAQVETHLVVSPLGQRLLHDELGMEGIDLAALAGRGSGAGSASTAAPEGLVLHHYRDVGAPIASGSFRNQGMIVIPCSSNSLAAIASGHSQNLLHRAAHVALKERRRLVLVHRETPLGLIDIRNMQAVTEAGGIICPANPGFYMLPRTLDDLVDFMVARCLDLLEIEHDLPMRWTGKPPTQRTEG